MLKTDVLAICLADVHLSHNAPAARQTEEDWYGVQRNYLQQLLAIQKQFQAPVVIAGDVMHKWNAPAELISLAIKWLPECYAVPGQHDLPWHEYDNLKRSAFYTLMEAGKIKLLEPSKPIEVGEGNYVVRLHGFPYGFPVKPCKDPMDMLVELAVVHDYIWVGDHSYPGAPEDKNTKAYRSRLRGYDAAIFGDNHKGFLSGKTDKQGHRLEILNAGTFMRRNTDERNYQPVVGLLQRDGTFVRHKLDVSRDTFTDEKELAKTLVATGNLEELMERLVALRDAATDFEGTLRTCVNQPDVPAEVRRWVLKALEGGKGNVS